MGKFNKVGKFGSKNSGRFDDTRSKKSSGGKFGRRDSYSSGRDSSSKFGDRPERKFDRESFSKEKSSGFTVHETVCDRCGVKCDVPFKPTNNKPIYCRSCFRKNNSGSSDRGTDRFEQFEDRHATPSDRFENKSNISSKDLEQINQKLDKIMKALKLN